MRQSITGKGVIEVPNIPVGFCQCGCGQKTKIVTQDDPARGYKKGDYRRFVNYHASNKNHLLTKRCEICGVEFLPQKKSRQESQKTCSAKCRNAYNSQKGAAKRAEKLRGRGEGKSYSKINGRHKHRVVMEALLGRPLRINEVVHHKDGNHLNNSPSNLQLLKSQSEHASLHNFLRWERWREQNG